MEMQLIVNLQDDQLEDIIFNTLDFDAWRGGHTVETLVRVITGMGILRPYPDARYLENHTRVLIARLIQRGDLDMRADGILVVPADSFDRLEVEEFGRCWYVLQGRQILGPFSDQGEALGALSSIRATQQCKLLERPASR